HFGVSTKIKEHLICKRDHFYVSGVVISAEHVAIELPVFAQPAFLRALITEEIRYRIPTNREGKIPPFFCYHAGNCGGHFRTQRYFSITPVSKCIRLLVDDLFACLAPIQL